LVRTDDGRQEEERNISLRFLQFLVRVRVRRQHNMREVLRLEDIFKKSVGEPKDRDFKIRRIPFSNFTANRKLCPQMMICLLAREITETGEQLLHQCRGVREGGFLAYNFKEVKPLTKKDFV
jgi:hypothetical protein